MKLFKTVRPFMYAAFAVAAVTSCSDIDEFGGDNKEDEVGTGTSKIEGLCINEASNDSDFVELYNSSDKTISLAKFVLSDDKGLANEEAMTFSATAQIKAGEFLVFEKDEDFTFGIGDGDTIQLFDAEGELVASLAFPDNGEKYESYGCLKDGDTSKVGELEGATPGRSNSEEADKDEDEDEDKKDPEVETTGFSVIINEISSKGEPADWVELYNTSDSDVDLEGYILTDDLEDLEKTYVFPAGSVVEAGGYLLLEKDVDFTFGLKDGDIVYILKGEEILESSEAIAEEADEDGMSWGRKTDGAEEWIVFNAPTPGEENGTGVEIPESDLIGKLVINEIYTFGDQMTLEDLDWIELYNTTDKEISLEGLKLWEGGGSEEAWTFPKGAKIAANGRYVVETDKELLLNDPTNYPSWGLSKGPDEVIVLASAEMSIIDEVECPSMNENESYGRVNDGAEEFQIFAQHTKNSENTGDPREDFENTTGLYINEVYHDNSDEVPGDHDWDTDRDFIELYNSTNSPIDISGYQMTDDKHEDYFTIPEGTIIEAGGYVVFEAELKDTPDANCFPFGLGKGGDWVFLTDADDNQVDEIEIPSFKDDGVFGDICDLGCTFGRKTDGSKEWVAFAEASKGASNDGKGIKGEM